MVCRKAAAVRCNLHVLPNLTTESIESQNIDSVIWRDNIYMHSNRNIKWHTPRITKKDRWGSNKHKSALIWITGLSASGKSTIAIELEHKLFQQNIKTFVLDGDNVRHGLNKDLGFSPEDRKENLRRVGEVAKLLVDAGLLAIAAFISPYASDRDSIRELFSKDNEEFIEVYLKCALDVCESRDPKGLYKKARTGEIPEFTGVSQPYEMPVNPEIIIETDKLGIEESVESLIAYLKKKKII
jgi:adenylylsulfate kinase